MIPEKDTGHSSSRLLLEETIRLLKRYGVKPKKRLSQSFIVDENLVRLLVESVKPKPSDVIVEIGAGLGTLTLELAKYGSRIKAVEIDPILIRVLKDRLSCFENVDVIQGDFLKMNLDGNVFTGNIPYHLSTPIIFKILKQKYDRSVITVQKEVAERIVSKPGTKGYGRLTVSVNVLAEPRIIGSFNPSSFYPMPKVSHSVILLKPLEKSVDTILLEWLLRAMFSQRNRLASTVLKKALERFYGDKGLLIYQEVSRLIPEDKRVFELSVQDFLSLNQAISSLSSNMGAYFNSSR
ncbi:MAG: 16S rRNA (adenine(1518)-N(6)/adenine(1519)-N(6))-dimethyltransferase RsmA [Thermoproteota archaeon]